MQGAKSPSKLPQPPGQANEKKKIDGRAHGGLRFSSEPARSHWGDEFGLICGLGTRERGLGVEAPSGKGELSFLLQEEASSSTSRGVQEMSFAKPFHSIPFAPRFFLASSLSPLFRRSNDRTGDKLPLSKNKSERWRGTWCFLRGRCCYYILQTPRSRPPTSQLLPRS